MMEPNQPPFQQPPSRFGYLNFPVNEANYQRNAKLGYLLLYGALGTILAVVGNIIGAIFQFYIVSIIVNMLVPFLIGYQAAKSAIKNELVDTLRHASLFGAISSGLTALFFAIVLCSCTLTAAISLESAGGLVDYLDRQDISAALIALIVLGTMIGGVLLYAAFGAVGAAVAGIRSGINSPPDFQFDEFGEG